MMLSSVQVISAEQVPDRQLLHRARFMERVTAAGLDPDDFGHLADRWWPHTGRGDEHRASVA